MKKLLIVTLIFLVILSLLLCSCGKENDTQGTDDTTSAALTTDAPEKVSGITMADLEKYVLVRPETASSELVDACLAMRSAIHDLTGVELTIKSDFYREGVASLKMSEYEILVGDCDRDESREVGAELKKNDYGYRLIGTKLVVCGGDEASTKEAMDAFLKDLAVSRSDLPEAMFYVENNRAYYRADYEVEELTVNGTPVSEYRIVYPRANKGNEMSLAEKLCEAIAEKTGFVLKVVSDRESTEGKEILIGTTNRTVSSLTGATIADGKYLCASDGDYICAKGTDALGNFFAVNGLIALLTEGSGSVRQVTMTADAQFDVPSMGEKLKSMSFNILVSKVTEQRQKSVSDTILKYLPDTVGVQEASPSWMTYLNKTLSSFYASVGEGRDGGSSGKHSAIFYRKDRFELIETDTKWMSDTPGTVSKFEESSLNRVYTYALLKVRESGKQILIVNTHLDHKSSAARTKQIKVLLTGIRDLLDKWGDLPVVLSGDFNAQPSSDVYRLVTGVLADSSKVALSAEESHTYHNYGSASAVIDYIFVDTKNISVDSYKVITDKENGMLPSDHYPLCIEYYIS